MSTVPLGFRGRASTKSTERGRSKPPSLPAEVDDLPLRDLHPGPRHERRLDRLAPALVRHADHGGVGDGRVSGQDVLTARCAITAPLGWPVVPLVYIWYTSASSGT